MLGLGYWDQNNKFAFLPSNNLPTHCWSLYRRKSDYTGNCIRIARLNDNAETDIGFRNNVVDTAAILAHCGSNTGVVVTFYNQFGGSNLTRYTNNTYAPRIAVAGAIVSFANGQPAIEFGQGTSGLSGTALQVTTGNLYNGLSTTFFTYESSFTGLHVLGGAGSVSSPFHVASENGGSLFPESSYGDTLPKKLYVNETLAVNSSTATSGQFYTALTGNQKLVSESGVQWTTANGHSIGIRADSLNSYFRGKLSEFMIYSNSIKTDSDIYNTMKILNRAIKAY